MKKSIFTGLICLLLFVGVNVASADTDVAVSIGFRDALSPYGSWVNVSNCGNCWRPNVGSGFMPYTNGHWVYTSYGPTWVGEEPWAWAAYHYGNWVYSSRYGWIWQPGYTWNPARVTWSTGPGYIGWSPYLQASAADTNFWVFIDSSRFGYRDYSPYLIRGPRALDLFARRAVQIRRARLERAELERLIRKPVRLVEVEHRRIRADHRDTKLVIPVSEKRRILSHVSRVAKGGRIHLAKEKKELKVSGKGHAQSKTEIRSRVTHRGSKVTEKTQIKTKSKLVSARGKTKKVEIREIKNQQLKKAKVHKKGKSKRY